MSATQRPVLNDRYELQQRIGRGGMADVFLARDLLLDRPVAIKVLFPEFAADPAFVERFRREAQAAANLNHPNIVGVYDWGRYGSTYFMAMEFVPGRTLAELGPEHAPEMKRGPHTFIRGPAPEQAALHVGDPLAAGAVPQGERAVPRRST